MGIPKTIIIIGFSVIFYSCSSFDVSDFEKKQYIDVQTLIDDYVRLKKSRDSVQRDSILLVKLKQHETKLKDIQGYKAFVEQLDFSNKDDAYKKAEVALNSYYKSLKKKIDYLMHLNKVEDNLDFESVKTYQEHKDSLNNSLAILPHFSERIKKSLIKVDEFIIERKQYDAISKAIPLLFEYDRKAACEKLDTTIFKIRCFKDKISEKRKKEKCN